MDYLETIHFSGTIAPETSWLVAEDLINLLHVRVRKLGSNWDSLQIIFDLFHFRGTQKHTSCVLVLDSPCQS